MPNYTISTDKKKLDIDVIQSFLNDDSYWAQDRKREIIVKSIENSICFGAYLGERQVGFARVVTDYAVFAWVLDVFVLKEEQGQGIGKQLMQSITTHRELIKVKHWGLATDDAHGLYEKYGFKCHYERAKQLMSRKVEF